MKPSELTKREYFAAMALQGVLANCYLESTNGFSSCAIDAVRLADALITQLNKIKVGQ